MKSATTITITKGAKLRAEPTIIHTADVSPTLP